MSHDSRVRILQEPEYGSSGARHFPQTANPRSQSAQRATPTTAPGHPLQTRPWRKIAAARGWYELAPASFAGVVARTTAAESGDHALVRLQGVGREIRPSSGQMFLEDSHLNALWTEYQRVRSGGGFVRKRSMVSITCATGQSGRIPVRLQGPSAWLPCIYLRIESGLYRLERNR